jgi:carnitine-CoA ligase
MLPTHPDRLLGSLLPAWAEERSDAPWILSDGGCWTFGDAHERVEAYAAGWARHGVGRGTRVALLLENSAEYVMIVTSLVRVGAVFVPINPDFSGPYLTGLLRTLSPAAIVLGAHADDVTWAVVAGSPVRLVVAATESGPSLEKLRVTTLEELRSDSRSTPHVEQDSGEVASVLLTSGTTGPSKGVISSHEAWITGVEVTCRGRGVNDEDVFHLCTPMSHSASWALNIWSSLWCGLPVVICEKYSTSDFWPSVRRHGATQLCTIGPAHMWLWNRPEEPDDAANPARVWTAVPLPGEMWKPFCDRFGLQAIVSMYGQTEVMPATMGDAQEQEKPGSSGPAHPGVELRVVDECDRTVSRGTPGELLVRPRRPHVMFEGYLGEPVARSDSDWFRTGDLVTIDSDGDVYFVDRKSDHIRWRGHNVSSAEVETVLGRHPSVAEVAAYAVPSPEGEDDVMVAVIPCDDAAFDARELITFAAGQLPKYAVPRYVEVVDALPRTATGKVEKYLLRQRGVTPSSWYKN